MTNRKVALEDKRVAIVQRRQAGDTHASDGSELALIACDLEGLAAMTPAIVEPVAAARQAMNEATSARQRAAAALSSAEDAALADALHQRLNELASLMADAVNRDDAQIKRRRTFRPDWVMPAELLLKLQLRAAARPDLARPAWRTAAVDLAKPQPAA